ncbi:hypothetical protein P8452_03099 [Trifolium repens]|nr:hypothetical protein P8452_03099 [Trifolium repens]
MRKCTAEPEYDLHSFFTCPAILDSWATAALGAAVYNRLQCGLYSSLAIAALFSTLPSSLLLTIYSRWLVPVPCHLLHLLEDQTQVLVAR